MRTRLDPIEYGPRAAAFAVGGTIEDLRTWRFLGLLPEIGRRSGRSVTYSRAEIGTIALGAFLARVAGLRLADALKIAVARPELGAPDAGGVLTIALDPDMRAPRSICSVPADFIDWGDDPPVATIEVDLAALARRVDERLAAAGAGIVEADDADEIEGAAHVAA